MIDSVMLEQFEYGVQIGVSDTFAAAPSFDVERLPFMRTTMIRAIQVVAGETLTRYSYPTDWWQGVKQRWMPRWLQSRFPVRTVTIEARALYPMVSLPRERHVVRLEVQ